MYKRQVKWIPLLLTDNIAAEGDEVFSLDLFSATNATIATIDAGLRHWRSLRAERNGTEPGGSCTRCRRDADEMQTSAEALVEASCF